MATASLARRGGSVAKFRGGGSPPVGRPLSACKEDGRLSLQPTHASPEGLTAAEKKIVALHEEACAAGQKNYVDPVTGYLVLTKVAHLERGNCCGSSCRHCEFNTSWDSKLNPKILCKERKWHPESTRLCTRVTVAILKEAFSGMWEPKKDAPSKIMFATYGFLSIWSNEC